MAAVGRHSSSFLSQPSGGCGGGPHPSSGRGDRDTRLEEKSDRISKEKQKFFRLSAFYADHKYRRRAGGQTGAVCSAGGGSASGSGSSSDSGAEASPPVPSPFEPTPSPAPAPVPASSKSPPWGFAAAAAAATAASAQKKASGGPECFVPGRRSEKVFSDGVSALKFQPGFGQLKGLFDGLSHLFTAPSHNRTRTIGSVNYSLSRRKREKEEKKTQQPKVHCRNADGGSTSTPEAVGPDPAEMPRRPGPPTERVRPPRDAVDGERAAKIVVKQKVPPAKIPVPPSAGSQGRKVTRPAPSPNTNPQIPAREYMTPSRLVKTAVNSKRLEQERRRILKGEGPFFGGVNLGPFGYLTVGRPPVNPAYPRSPFRSLPDDPELKKRHLIEEATQTHHRYHHRYHHPVPVPSTSVVPPRKKTGKEPADPSAGLFSLLLLVIHSLSPLYLLAWRNPILAVHPFLQRMNGLLRNRENLRACVRSTPWRVAVCGGISGTELLPKRNRAGDPGREGGWSRAELALVFEHIGCVTEGRGILVLLLRRREGPPAGLS